MIISDVRHSVLDHLRGKIVLGEFSAGQRLNEADLASDLNISRPPLREALRILESEHLVENVPRKGTYVTKLTNENFQGIYQARGMIECYSIDLIEKKRITDFSPMISALNMSAGLKTEPGADPQEIMNCLKVYADFHSKLVELGDNSYLTRFYQSIAGNLIRYQFLFFSKRKYRESVLEEHHHILDLIRTGAFGEAKENLLFHINRSLEQIGTEGF